MGDRLALRGGPRPDQGGRAARLLISDDGRGCQSADVGAGRFGLTSMRERAANIGARLRIGSTIGQGTEICVEWPDPSDE